MSSVSSLWPPDQKLFFDLIVNKYEIKKIPNCTLFGMKCSKILTVSGAPPQTPLGSLRRSLDPLVARGFLPSAIAASRLRHLQYPHLHCLQLFYPHGLKPSSVKGRWPMRLGGTEPELLGGIDAPADPLPPLCGRHKWMAS